jgi:hypothetical protein
LEGTVPPKSVQIASWTWAANSVILKLLVPVGALALNALRHRGSVHSDSPELLLMAGGFYFFAVTVPILLIAALLFVKLRRGRNWARVVVVVVTVASVLLAIGNFQTLRIVYGSNLDLATLGTFFLYACVSPVAMVVTAILLFSTPANLFFRGETDE